MQATAARPDGPGRRLVGGRGGRPRPTRPGPPRSCHRGERRPSRPRAARRPRPRPGAAVVGLDAAVDRDPQLRPRRAQSPRPCPGPTASNVWPPKPGITLMTRTASSRVEERLDPDNGVGGFSDRRRLAAGARGCVREQVQRVGHGLDVEDDPSHPAWTKSSRYRAGSEIIRWVSNGKSVTLPPVGDHRGAVAQVGDEMAVHHVEVDAPPRRRASARRAPRPSGRSRSSGATA